MVIHVPLIDDGASAGGYDGDDVEVFDDYDAIGDVIEIRAGVFSPALPTAALPALKHLL